MQLGATFYRLAAAGMLLILAGCSTAPQKTAEPPPPPSSGATPADQAPQHPTPILASVEGFYSWDARTGVPVIDQVLTALTTNDASLNGRLQMSTQPCPVAGVNGPIPCESGQADGAPVPVFRYFWCGPTYLTPTEAAGTLSRYLATGPHLYAAYQLKEGGPKGLGARSGVLMANSLQDSSALLLYLDAEGKIVSMKTGCGQPGALAPVASTVTYLLPPLAGQEAKAEQSAYITQLLQSELQQILRGLAFATGEESCDGLNCSPPVPLQINEGIERRCNKIGPESLREAGGYDPALHKEQLDAFESVCGQSAQIAGATPPPADSVILATFESAKIRVRGALGLLK